jgi:regulator of protease activity HflC (stomatin/prohibitin superfamily)
LAVIAGAVIVLLIAVIVVGSAFVQVRYGTVALVARFGGLTGDVLDPGPHWRIPVVDRLVIVPTVQQSYETSDVPETSGADYPDYPVSAQTVDGQQITVKYTVLFRIPGEAAVSVVQNYGETREVVENVVKRSRSWARLVAQNYTAEDLYSGEGIFAYQTAVSDVLRDEFVEAGIRLDEFLVRKVDFDEEYINAIEQQQIAQEAIETARYQSEAAEFEKERQIRLAQAEAERTLLLAQAEAQSQRLLADAEAYSIGARGATLREYPEVVQWQFVRNLEDVQWGIMPGENLTPLIPIPSVGGAVVTPGTGE